MLRKIGLVSLAVAGLVLVGCSCCKAKTIAVKERKSCGGCKLVYEDGSPAECCKTWKKPACNRCK